ncbi:MAG: cytochrome c [Pseudobdellovibrionaceae bacterium]
MSENRDQYNHGGMLAFLFSMAFVFVFFIYIIAIHPGVDLQENIQDPPSASAPVLAEVDVSKVTEPWVANPDMVTHGKKLFAQNCAMCHGNEGKGDGAAGQALNPKPRNLVTGPWKKGGGFIGWYTVVTEGIAGSSMAAYAHLKPVDRWALVQFIDSITTAKVKEEPAKVAEFAKSAK